jgi:3-oxoacyl-[acyl-carrier protein] reductase
MSLLTDRSAVVTGAAQGIGRAIATVLAREGARVVIADINGDAAAATAAELSATGARAIPVTCDVTDEAAVQTMVDTTVREFGTIDILVNNAGITRDATMPKMSLADFRLVLDVHLVGAWLATKAASQVMREQRRGAIVNISSISGKVGNFGQTNYSAAKAGMIGLTKASAKELARFGVRVNAIQPGLIRTAMTAAMPEEVRAKMMSDIPLGRMGEPEDIANVALFLASDLSAYLTGTVTEVSGGRHM